MVRDENTNKNMLKIVDFLWKCVPFVLLFYQISYFKSILTKYLINQKLPASDTLCLTFFLKFIELKEKINIEAGLAFEMHKRT